MKLGAFEVNEPLPELNEPHVLAMLQPWVDVGSVGTLVLSWMEAHFEAKELAKLVRPGDFFDFTRYRPTIYRKEGQRQVAIPNAYVTYAKRKTGNDFLFLHLLEPHSQSEVYVDSMIRLLTKFNAKRYCLIGSMYDYVPHTKPLLVTGRAEEKETQQSLEKMGITSSDYQGPTTIISLLTQQAPKMKMETMSLIVHLPQYTQLDDDFMGAVRLMKVLGSLYELPEDEAYLEKAEQQLEQINLALEKNPQLKTTIEQLETRYERRAKRRREEEETSQLSPEIERFLNEMEKRFREN